MASPSPSSSPSSSAAAAPTAADATTPPPPPPSLPLSLPPPPPNPLSSSSSRRLPPPCWTNEETLALIDSYRDKWYSLRRGNLRAAHWDEVAAAVHARCRHFPSSTPKTPVQCRHKVEKLRKRYRSEKHRSLSLDPSSPPSSPWIFFRHMDLMERGPSAASGAGVTLAADPPDSDSSDDGAAPAGRPYPPAANGGALRFKIPKAIRSKIVGSRPDPNPNNPNPNPGRFFRGFGGGGGGGGGGVGGAAKPGLEEMRRRLERKRRREGRREESDAVGEMVGALRVLGDGYMRMEEMKMEMAREMEKVRMEMELKRTEMILETQRRIVDSVLKGFVGSKKAKVSPDS